MGILNLSSVHVLTHTILLDEIQLLFKITAVFSWYSYLPICQTDSCKNLSTVTFI